jgi:PAS domain S-box-containing protein
MTKEHHVKDPSRTNQDLLEENSFLRQRIQELEQSESERKTVEEELRKGWQQFQELVETLYDWVWEVDFKGQYTYVSPRVKAVLGYEPKDIVGKTPFDLMPAEEAQRVAGIFGSLVLQQRPIIALENINIHKDGHPVVLETNGTPFHDAHGNFAGYRGTDRDITDRKRAEEELQQSERIKTVMSQIANAFLTVPDEEMYAEVLAVVLKATKSKFGIFGFISENGDLIIPSMTREIWSECQVPDKSIVFPSDTWGHSLWGRAIREKKALYSNSPFHTPEGHIHIDNFLTVPIVFGNKTIGLLSVANREQGYAEEHKNLLERVTTYISPILNARLQRDQQEHERKKTEEELRESEQKLAGIIEFLPDATFVIDLEGKVIAWNRAIEEMTGVQKKDILGKGKYAYAVPFYGQPRPILIDLVFVSDSEIKQKYDFVEKKGNHLWAETFVAGTYRGKGAYLSGIAAPLFDSHGNIIGAIESIRDITKRKRAEESLHDSEHRLSELINFLPDPTLAIDENKRVIIWNRAMEEMTGISAQEMIGKGNYAYAVPFYGEARPQIMDLFWEHDHVITEKYPLLRTEGENLVIEVLCPALYSGKGAYVWAKASPLRNPEGNMIGAIEVIRDVTELRRTEEALRENMSKQERALQISTALYEVSANLLLNRTLDENLQLIVNKAAEVWGTDTSYIALADEAKEKVRMHTLFGIKTKDFIEMEIPFGVGLGGYVMKSRAGLIIDDYFNDEEIKHSVSISQIVKNEGVVSGMGVPIQSETEDLGVLYVFHRQTRKFDKSDLNALEMFGRLAALEMTGKRRQDALSETENMYKTLANSSYAGVYIVQDGKFQFLNPHITEYSGYAEAESIGSNALGFVHPDDREATRKNAIAMLQGKRSTPYEYRIIDSKGNIKRFIETVRSTTYGGTSAVLGNTMDITERYRMEMLLRQAQKMESIGTLAGGIAHDFNNILGAILGYTEMVLTSREMSDRQRHYYLEQAYKAGERARELVKQILTFSRQREQERKPVLIAPIIKEGIKLLRASLPTTIKINQDIADASVMVLADPTQIHQVVMNLCTNASHAMREEGGILDIKLVREKIDVLGTPRPLNLTSGDYAKLTVSDTGHGIEAAIMDRIFDPFFTTKEVGQGTGLGLSVVYGIIRDYGGAIDVSSEPGKGTTVTVYFPLIEAEEKRYKQVPELIPRGSERILFIDDEAALAELGTLMLTALGYHVISKTSSIDALEAFRAIPHNFDLVITDMTMPNIRGDHLAKELLKIRPDIPIILCTGFSETTSEEKARSLGIRQLIMKPVSKKVLAKAVREVLDR